MSFLCRLSCVLLAALCPLVAAADGFRDATPEELAMTGVPGAPGAHAAILQWDHRQDDLDAWETEYLRVKIFDREGTKYGDIELPFITQWTWIKNIQARTIHADGKVIPFTGETFDKVIAQRPHGLALMMKTFSLPDVQPGSIIEYSYVRQRSRATLAATEWTVQHTLPVLKETIWFRPFRNAKSFFTFQGLPPGKTLKENGVHFELELENIAPYEEEPYSPPERVTRARINFYYAEAGEYQAQIDPDPAKYWDYVGGKTASGILMYGLSDARSIRQAAQELTAGVTSADEKLRRLYARAQKTRNVSFELSLTEVEVDKSELTANRGADDTLVKGYGSKYDINKLFASLAQAAGFEAYIVYAAGRRHGFFARNVPDFSQLNHDIVLVVVDGKERYFDPGTPMTPYGLLPWEVTSVPAMKFVKKGVAAFVQTSHQPATDAVIHRKANLRIDGGVVKGTITASFTGQRALQWRLSGRNDDEATNRKTMEDAVRTWLPEGSIVRLTALRAMKGVEEPLVAELDVEIPNLGASAGSRLMLPLAIFSLSSKNPFVAEQRKRDIYFQYESQTEDEIVLAVPDGHAVDAVPADSQSDLGLLSYKNQWSRGEGTVTLRRTFTVNSLLIPKTHYPHIRTLFNRSLAADQESVILRPKS